MKKVLVTGATGFIGRHFVAYLRECDIQVRALTRPKSVTDHLVANGVDIVVASLANPNELARAMHGADTVVHLAGLTHGDRDSLFRANGDSCRAIADAASQLMNPPRIIYVSSLAAAGPAEQRQMVLSEVDEPHPISHYGQSKRAGEIEFQKRADNFPCTIIRPGIVFGPYDNATKMIFEPIYRYRLHVVVGFHTPPLSMIYVDDLVRLIAAACERGERLVRDSSGVYSSTGYYFACDNSEYPTYVQLGKKIAAALDRSVVVWPIWRSVGYVVGAASQTAARLRGKSTPFNLDKIREATVTSWACSAAKAQSQLTFQPRKCLDDYIHHTAKWYRENGWL